jgi:hypothetical protein
MLSKYSICAFLAVGLFYPAAAYAVGLGVGVFGGYAVPTRDMAAEERFDLRPSTALGVRAFFDIHEHFGADLAAAYSFNFPPGEKRYEWAEITELLPVNFGAYYEVEAGSFRFSPGGGVGYYFLTTKLASTVRGYDSGFGVLRPVKVNFNAPGVYGGAGVSYLLGRFALGVTPRFNYIFNSGEYEGEEIYGGSRTIIKDWNDAYFELAAGVIYTLF